MLGGPPGDVIQTVELFNYQTGTLEIVEVVPAGNDEELLVALPTGDLSRFVNPVNREITVELVWKSESFSGPPFSWIIDIDQAVWQID